VTALSPRGYARPTTSTHPVPPYANMNNYLDGHGQQNGQKAWARRGGNKFGLLSGCAAVDVGPYDAIWFKTGAGLYH